MNTNLILITGKSTTGKSTSFMHMENREGVVYLNCENNKALPFPKRGMKTYNITDPHQVPNTIIAAEEKEDIHTIIVDSLTFLMDMYETQYVNTATNTQKAWGQYASFFREMMQAAVAKSTKRIIFTGHTSDIQVSEYVTETRVKVKGSLNDRGIESFFTSVVSTKRMEIRDLEEFDNDLLNITPEEEAVGFKYVFQTLLTKETAKESIRSPVGMWKRNETYIDNNIEHVLNRLAEFYSE